MNIEAIYQQLGALVSNVPNLRYTDPRHGFTDNTLQWLAKAQALVKAMPFPNNSIALDVQVGLLMRTRGHGSYVDQIKLILLKSLAEAELLVPASMSGAFIAVGNSFDAIAAVSKIFSSAKIDLMIVDPYMDETILSDYAVLAIEGVVLRLLTDKDGAKPGLMPSLQRWRAQYDGLRPVEIRFAKSRTLHDRLVLCDGQEAWILTQSLKDFAKRSPATLQKAETELSRLKCEAYDEIWDVSHSDI